MGVDLHVLQFLTSVRNATNRPFGRTLTLGRQGFHIADSSRAYASVLLGADLNNIQPAGERWADGLLTFFGSSSVVALDASPFEGATMVHDLNTPVPQNMYGQFDTIFDGGTLEHVFNFPTALANITKLLRLGGRFISVNAANNQLGHGLYQFSPELMWRAFSEENGFQIDRMYLSYLHQPPKLILVEDPAVLGRRVEIGTTPGPTYLLLSAAKIADVQSVKAQQSDYAQAWASVKPSINTTRTEEALPVNGRPEGVSAIT